MEKSFFCLLALIGMVSLSLQASPRELNVETEPHISKISTRLSSANISKDQKNLILEKAKENFYECQLMYQNENKEIPLGPLYGQYRGCVGRYTGVALARVSALEQGTRMQYFRDQEDKIVRADEVLHPNNYVQENSSEEREHRRKNDDSSEWQ